MENPWVNSPGDDFSEDIVCDLAKIRISAANALRNIQATYRDIMGCDNRDDDRFEQGDCIFDESDSDCACSIEAEKDIEPTYDWDKTQLMQNPRNTLCWNCKSFFFSPMREFPSEFNPRLFRYHEVKIEPSECQECMRCDTNCVYNNFISTIGDGPALKHPPKVDNFNDIPKVKKNKKQERPLKVTIPEPFQMTMRDEIQKPIKELKLELLRKAINDEHEKELEISVHSNPVPGHTYMPLYKEMTKKNEARKQMRKSKAAIIKTNATKSFSSTFDKKISRADSVPDLSTMRETHVPKANPVPKYILDPSFTERMRNKEAMRRMRIKERAEETLKKSSLPFSKRNMLHKSISTSNLEEVNESQFIHKVFRTTNTACNLTKSKDIFENWNSRVSKISTPQDEKNCKDRYDKFLLSQTLPLSDVPIRMTTASLLRQKKNSQQQTNKKTEEEVLYKGNQKIRTQLQSQLKLSDQNLSSQEDFMKKLQNFREMRKARQEEYERELQEMGFRIEGKPLLIQRQVKIRKSSIHSLSRHSANTSLLNSDEEEDEDNNKSEDSSNSHTNESHNSEKTVDS